MKRASYRNGVDFIAMNDEPLELIAEHIATYTTVVLLAELFGVDEERIARDILKVRIEAKKQDSGECA